MPIGRVVQWIRLLWFGASVAALVYVIVGYSLGAWSTREPSIVLLGILVLLSFPLGLLGISLVGLLSDLLSSTPLHVLFANRYLEAVTLWACLTALGWLQWFVVVPWFVRVLRKRFGFGSQRAA